MKALATGRGQILILLAAWLFFGGGAASALVVYDRPAGEAKKAIRRAITDEVRRDVILAEINDWESRQQQHDKQVSAGRDSLFGVLRRRDAQRAEAEAIVEKLDETFGAMDRDFLDLRFRVRDEVTRAEWVGIAARESG